MPLVRSINGSCSTKQSALPSWRVRGLLSIKSMVTLRFMAIALTLLIMFSYLDCFHRINKHDDSVGLLFDSFFLPSQQQQQQSERQDGFSQRPIMVQSASDGNSSSFTNISRLVLHQNVSHYYNVTPSRFNHFWVNHGTERHRLAEAVPENCTLEATWMKDHHPSCNLIHTVDMTDFYFNPQRTFVRINGHERRKKLYMIGRGGFRSAFMFHEYDGSRRVLKTLVYRDDKGFHPRQFDRMRKDAVVSEQLTSSPYIADIYGYCAMAALVDFSEEEDMLKVFKQGVKPSKSSLFQISYDVAQSLADAHLLNEHGRVTIAHMDIKPNQWIWLNNRFVLNDFNLAKFLTWNEKEQQNCKISSGYSEGRWQAPEQFLESAPRSEKADIFSLGYILNFLVTGGQKPYPDIKTGREAQDTVSNGTMHRITDPKILNSTHPFHIAVRAASEMCIKFDPKERPSAQQVADFLKQALDDSREKGLVDTLR